MAKLPALVDQATNRAVLALRPVMNPLQAQWNALPPGARRLVVIGAAVLATGFVVAFGWLPAARARDALTTRLPQLEAQLAIMRNQVEEVNAFAKAPATSIVPRTTGDVAALQSIFGREAQVNAVADGFRIVIPATGYANWWDKTGEALNRHTLVLRAASLARVDGAVNTVPAVAIDMRLGVEARVAGSTGNTASVRQGQ